MASLYEVLTTAGVQDTFVDKLIDDGWSIELFAMAASNLEKLDDEIRSMLGHLYEIATAVRDQHCVWRGRGAKPCKLQLCHRQVHQPLLSQKFQHLSPHG